MVWHLSDTVLSIKNVSKEYSGNPVLKNVSMDVRKGDVYKRQVKAFPIPELPPLMTTTRCILEFLQNAGDDLYCFIDQRMGMGGH